MASHVGILRLDPQLVRRIMMTATKRIRMGEHWRSRHQWKSRTSQLLSSHERDPSRAPITSVMESVLCMSAKSERGSSGVVSKSLLWMTIAHDRPTFRNRESSWMWVSLSTTNREDTRREPLRATRIHPPRSRAFHDQLFESRTRLLMSSPEKENYIRTGNVQSIRLHVGNQSQLV